MVKLASFLAIVAIVSVLVALAAAPVAAQQGGGQYPSVSGLTQFSAESNFMSLAGYLRWMTFKEQGIWLSVPEAKRIVAEQSGG